MFLALNTWSQRQTSPTTTHGDDPTDHAFDDSPSMERPSESYGAWQATAIFDLKPFSAPPGR
jgi:hypothetical protein